MLENGNLSKGIRLYNEWAVMSGYEPIIAVNAMPLIVQVGEMTLIHHNSELEQISCQQQQ